MKYFSVNLKFLRKSSGMTQAEIKDSLGIEATTWGNYERGQSFPNLNLFSEIVKYFGISADDLLYKDLSNAHLIPKKEDQKKQENAHLNAHLIAHPIDKKKTNYPDLNDLETALEHALNEEQAPYKTIRDEVTEIGDKVAKIEAFISKLSNEMEGRGKSKVKRSAKK